MTDHPASRDPPQRRVVIPLRRSASGMAPALDGGASMLAKLAFAATLPLFAQVFYYLNEYPAPYLLSKAWPFLTLPLALYGMVRLKLPAGRMFLLVLAYGLGFTPMVSVIQLGNGFLDALTTTIKAWPFTYYFSLSAVLALLAVPPESVRKAVLGLGAATFFLMVIIYLVAPTSWYADNPADSKLLLFDLERGYRVYMPMFFGMILVFFLSRAFVLRRNILYGLCVVLAFAPMLLIYKQRAAIAAALVVVIFGMAMSLPQRARRIVIGLGLAAVAVGVFLVGRKLGLLPGGAAPGDAQDAFGASLSVRQNSSALAFAFLGDDPLRWIFGVGATTRFSTVTLNDIFGNDQFFIADLGWIGVVFEYGIIGAVLLAALHFWCFVTAFRLTRGLEDPFALALSDYVLYLIISSAVYSVVFTPGELGVVMALTIYLDRRRRLLPPGPPPEERRLLPIGRTSGGRRVTLGRSGAIARAG
ncbi:hypothetical protein [Xanthobacter versatilis]|uniref:O-antigen ligase domain-containing protein n=1 Tax=Xanthobacter autotrophicus (strain ATCC BAA-1158 / Py2) TaxID=78245 RepID=A7IGQ8_XANP2|nr:conserved hypothetical protein [Xanthobacter autotrophicus Py2]